jgi:hypothetical protein
MLYFPPHLKFISLTIDPDTEDAEEEPAFYGATSHSSRGEGHRVRQVHVKTAVRTEAWRTSVLLAWVVGLHLFVDLLQSLCLDIETYLGSFALS